MPSSCNVFSQPGPLPPTKIQAANINSKTGDGIKNNKNKHKTTTEKTSSNSKWWSTGKKKSSSTTTTIYVPQPDPDFNMRLDELTQYQLDKMAELKKALGEELLEKTPIYNDQFSILRWLIAHNYKIEEIVPRFEKASAILRAMNLTNLVIEDLDKLNHYLRHLTPAAEYFPGGVMGYDREGNVIGVQALGYACPKALSFCGRVSDLYRLTIHETVLIYQLVRAQERKTGRKLGLRVIIDLNGFNSDHVHAFSLKSYANALKYLQNLFPDLARQVYVINAPAMVAVAYKIVKSVLSEESRRKVVFLGTDYQQILHADIGAEQLFPRWGGSLQPNGGHPETGHLRVSGMPPNSLRYLPEKNPLHVADHQLQLLNVPARNRREIEVDIPADDSTIHWFFIGNGDVEFVVVDEDGAELWPQFRVITEFVPEFGSVRCRRIGKHRVILDNTFSTFFSKEVKFHVSVQPPPSDEPQTLLVQQQQQQQNHQQQQIQQQQQPVAAST